MLWLYSRAKEADLNWPFTSPVKLWPAETMVWVFGRAARHLSKLGLQFTALSREMQDALGAIERFKAIDAWD